MFSGGPFLAPCLRPLPSSSVSHAHWVSVLTCGLQGNWGYVCGFHKIAFCMVFTVIQPGLWSLAPHQTLIVVGGVIFIKTHMLYSQRDRFIARDDEARSIQVDVSRRWLHQYWPHTSALSAVDTSQQLPSSPELQGALQEINWPRFFSAADWFGCLLPECTAEGFAVRFWNLCWRLWVWNGDDGGHCITECWSRALIEKIKQPLVFVQLQLRFQRPQLNSSVLDCSPTPSR